MKTQSRMKLISMVITLVVTTAIWAAWGARRAAATPPPIGDRQAFGLVGVTFGQTAQLNVSNITPPPEPDEPPPDPDEPPPDGDMPIQVEMMIFDGEGNLLARAMRRLGAGQSASLSVNGDLLPRVGNRVRLRALVKANPPPEGDKSADQRRRMSHLVVSTLEVIENATSRTSFVLQPPPTGD